MGRRSRVKKAKAAAAGQRGSRERAPELRNPTRPTDRARRGTEWRLDVAIAGMLVLVTLAIYGQVIGHGFVNLDDDLYVYGNAHVRQGLTWSSVAWAFETLEAGYWHPLTWLSHMLDDELFGLHAGYHHLVNVLLHIASALLLYAFLRRATGLVWRSAAVAGLFAVHPLHVESVAWIAERKDVLSTLFLMLTLLAYEQYARKPSWRRYAAVVGLFVLGLMAKPMLVTVPFLLLLLDYWPLGRLALAQGAAPLGEGPVGRRMLPAEEASTRVAPGHEASGPMALVPPATATRLLLEKLPLLLLVVAPSVMTYMAQYREGVAPLREMVPFMTRLANALVSYGVYIGKLAWPSGMAPFYPYRRSIPMVDWLGALVLLCAATAAVVWKGRKLPYLPFGWLWYVGTLVPVIGLVQIGAHRMADRYTYVPSIGLFVMASWGLTDLGSRWRHGRRYLAAVAAAASVAYAVVAWEQTGYWRNSETLCRHALEVTEQNDLAHINLAQALESEGRIDEAIDHYREALQIRPDHYLALRDLGGALAKQGRLDEASRALRESLVYYPKSAETLTNLCLVLTRQSRLEEAIERCRQALALVPDDVDAHNNLGVALDRQGKLDEAGREFRAVLAIDPGQSPARINLAAILARAGQLDMAAAQLETVLRRDPDNVDAHSILGAVFAAQGRIDEAVGQYRDVVRLNPAYPEAKDRLQVLLAKRGGSGIRTTESGSPEGRQPSQTNSEPP